MKPASLLEARALGTFRNRLLRWYDAHHRDLPWRNTHDAYPIWVSEIMLQQTRVGAVLEHYRRFFDRFPSVDVLARARQPSVLAAWSGLGYYRRARNLHAAAKIVAFKYRGEFPKTAAGLRELPGIGRYTAAAIASIAFREPTAVVDGNVERVLQRVTGNPTLADGEAWDLAKRLLTPQRPGDFNQAMMELGSTVCLPREPKCLACPIVDFCATRGAHARTRKEVRRTQDVSCALSFRNGSVRMVQRPRDAARMAAMWELPEIVISNGAEPAARFKHSILDTDFTVAVYTTDVDAGKSGCWIPESRLRRLPLTGLARKILRHFQVL